MVVRVPKGFGRRTAAILAIGLVAIALAWGFRLRRQVDVAAARLTLDSGPQATVLFDAKDQPAGTLYRENRIAVPLDAVSPYVVAAVLAAEDAKFFEHGGFDLRRIAGAAVANVRAGRIVQGASTITQQLARMSALGRTRTYSRKVREVLLARRLEAQVTKTAILESYLNRVYFGSGFYGIETAAHGFFGKPAADLDPAEAAVLAAVIRAPSVSSPRRPTDALLARRNRILERMHERGWLDEDAWRRSTVSPILTIESTPQGKTGGWFQDAVARELVQRFGTDRVYEDGLRVYTTLDPRIQAAAELAIEQRLDELTPRHPVQEDDPLEAALVALDPSTGEVRALIGGREFTARGFHRALDAKRQPGSAFKPILWAAALAAGYGPGSLLRDLDLPIEAPQGPWLPASDHEEGPELTLREALRTSSNRAAAHLIDELGPYWVVERAHAMGIHEPLPPYPSLALGTGELTLLELTGAYAVFANGGVVHEPHLIRRVEDADGTVLYRADPEWHKVLRDPTAFLMADLLADVMNRGTGYGARREGFRLPAGGKTGTSDDYHDAWFVGFTPHLAAGVWFGYDEPRPIGRRAYAASIAVPAWARFMKEATRGDPSDWFDPPDEVVTTSFCRSSGKLAVDACLTASAPQEIVPVDGVWTAMSLEDEPHSVGVYEDWVDLAYMPEPCDVHADPPMYELGSEEASIARVELYDSRASAAAEPAALRRYDPSPDSP